MQTRSPLLVGRQKELGELHRVLDRARTGSGGAVFMVGEPGIGKSRLAATATGAAFTMGVTALRGRGSSIGPMIPFRPLTEALMSLLRNGELPPIQEMGRYAPVLGHLIPEWGEDVISPAGGSLVILAEAVLRLLGIVGRESGCLLVLEDLHDADAETLAVVEYLVDNLEHQPVLLVGTIRGELCGALDLARSASQRGTGVLLELGRLSRAEMTAMAASCLDVTPEQVPRPAADQLWADSAGIPFLVEELLHGMITNGLLVPVAGSWQVVGELRTEVPAALVRSIAQRTDRLGPQARTLLSVAAVLGHRFPLSVLGAATDTDDRAVLVNLRAGAAAQLIIPDEPAPDWYAFRHPLTADALLAGLAPDERVSLSRRAAEAVEALHPDLAGDWCPLAASLRLAAGDCTRAGELFAEAGRRALRDGAAGSAIAMLDRANQLVADHDDPRLHADILESLFSALAETGEFERAFQLADHLNKLGDDGLDRPRRAALHARLARVAYLAGRWSDGIAQVEAARALLGDDARDEDAAPVDVIAAYLMLNVPSPDRVQAAAALARRAADAAQRAPLPSVACEAWQLLGVVTRENDLVGAQGYFERARQLAEEHSLPIQRGYAFVMQAGTRCLSNGDLTMLGRAHQEAQRVGLVTVAYEVEAIVALQMALRTDFAAATAAIDECWQAASRLQLGPLARFVLVTRATVAAHQAKRHEMEAALVEFRRWEGGSSRELPLSFGLARTFCALLNEDRDLADRELAQALAFEAENPTTFHLAGKHGLHLLLGVLAGRVVWPHYREIAAAGASHMRWNRHFVHLANAVLLGREGRYVDAAAAVTAAQDAAGIFPMAQHLGLRLVAEAATADGWGEPVDWLRRSEEYFHQAGVPAVASACRTLLRRGGASVQQRRTGTDQVPPALRRVGVTAREFEVFQLMVERVGNNAIANRLHISPRTVEKHVASLVAKTQQRDRDALNAYARLLLGGTS